MPVCRTTVLLRLRRAAAAILVLAAAPVAHALPLTVAVPGTSNLYYDDWGHDYALTDAEVADLAASTGTSFDDVALEYQAIGTGSRPVVVPEAFAPGASLWLAADGCVVDAGPRCTDAAGDDIGWDFRGLPVYSLIGLWSRTGDPDVLLPVGDPFFLGLSVPLLTVPDVGAPLHLVLAENDGIFSDNDGAYEVRIGSVPAPGVLSLLPFGAVALRQNRRRPRTAE